MTKAELVIIILLFLFQNTRITRLEIKVDDLRDMLIGDDSDEKKDI